MKYYLRTILISLLFISFCGLFTSFSFAEQKKYYNNKEIISSIFNAIDNVKTLRYELQCNERIKGRMQHTESKVKLQTSPRKLYLSLRGPEVLWIQGTNSGDAFVNPGAFPYINLNLDPYGKLMRTDQHHTIHEMGFHYLASILKEGMRRVGDKLDKYFTILGEENYNGRMCYKLSINFSDFAWQPYTVGKGENLTTISRKLFVSEYMVMENNPKIKWYDDVKEGQVIKVPNAYARLTLLMIDKELLLPVNNKIFDDKGVFETYEYYNLQVNTSIAPEEFTKNYKGYRF